MGLWDHHIADLEALGIRFSESEIRALETPDEGLQVLHLQPLWDPETPEGQVEFVIGPDAGVIYVPEILDLYDPAAVEPGTKLPIWQYVDQNWGVLDDGVPFYFATLDWQNEPVETPMSMMRTDEIAPYPFYGCLPLESEMEVEAAKRLVTCARNMIRDSLYDELDFIIRTEAESEWCFDVEGLWLSKKGVKPMTDEAQKVLDYMAQEWNEPEAVINSLVHSFDHLIQDHYIPDPRLTDEERKAWKHVPMKIGPLADYIPDDDFLAKDLYSSLAARQRNVQRRWEAHRGTYSLNHLLAREGVYG